MCSDLERVGFLPGSIRLASDLGAAEVSELVLGPSALFLASRRRF